MTNNTVKQHFGITQKDRVNQRKHESFLIWFTGLSGSGKSTIANALEQALFSQGIGTYLLDGDNIRQGINKDLSFSKEDRRENIRRIAEVSNLLIDAGIVVIAAFISPYLEDRENIKRIVGNENYFEIFINTPLETCEQRDVKGLYKKARSGKILGFTGISAPYEAPNSPNIEINTENTSVEQAVDLIIQRIQLKLKNA